MFIMRNGVCIVPVSFWDRFKIRTLSILVGFWVICKMLVRWLWDKKSFNVLEERDSPPACLVDSFLGQHKYVKLKGIKLHYVESGSKNNPLILLLHGFPDCWLSWRHQIPQLAQYFRVIALDLKGFGDSDKPARRNNYRIEIILEELKQLICTLGVQKCTIIGHDIGAILGWYLAYQSPEVIDKLILVSAAHPNISRRNLHNTSHYQWLNFVQLPHLPEIDALRDDVQIIKEYYPHLNAKDTYLEAYKYSFSRKEDWTGPLNYYRNLPFMEISEKIDPIEVPVLLIVGNKDKLVPLESIVKSTEFCEKSHVKIIDSVGHFPHQESPNNVNEVIMKYLGVKKMAHDLERSPSKGLMNIMFGAVSNTVKYGNSVLDSVQKRTNGVVGGIPSISLLSYSDKTDSN